MKSACTLGGSMWLTTRALYYMIQASRWRVKTANTILQIPWKKVKYDANTPTWSKNSVNS